MHSKGNHQQNEKTTYGIGENICQPYIKNTRNSYNSTAKKKKKKQLKIVREGGFPGGSVC